MGEWIRHRGSKTMPKRLEGMQFEARVRNGNTIEGKYILAWEQIMKPWDVMAYRIIGKIDPPSWPEDRIDVIGQNGNTGEHYAIDTSPERVENWQENVHITPETLTLRDIAPALKSAGVTIKLEDDPRTAPSFLQSALQTLTQRGKDYDKPEGERSAAAVAVAFNAITGRNLTEAEVWLVLQLVKDVRQWQNPGRYHADSALDCVAYAALKAEALASGEK